MKRKYQPPTIKIVEFKVEKGFVNSGFTLNEAGTQFEMNLLENESPKNERYNYINENEWSYWH